MAKKTAGSNRLTKDEYYLKPTIETVWQIPHDDGTWEERMVRHQIKTVPHWNDRMYLYTDFSKVEKKRIDDVTDWYKKFTSARNNTKMKEVKMYSIEADNQPSKRNQLKRLGFTPIGLSAVRLSSQCFVNGLIPLDGALKPPSPSKNIQINESYKKIIQFKLNDMFAVPYLVIEDYEYLPEKSVFEDIDFEKGIFENTIKEKLISNQEVVDVIMGPIISSPKVGNIGGLALSSYSGRSKLSQKLLDLIRRMTPPIFRGNLPPMNSRKGYSEKSLDGIGYKFFDRPEPVDATLKTVLSNKYSNISNAVYNRGIKTSEYSIFSTLLHPFDNPYAALNDLFVNFSDSEVKLREGLEDLNITKYEISKTNDALCEDVWLEVMHLRNYNPVIGAIEYASLNKGSMNSREHLKILLADTLGGKYENVASTVIRPLLSKFEGNVARISKYIARKNDVKEVNEEHIKEAQSIIKKDFEALLEGAYVKGAVISMDTMQKNEQKSWSAFEKELWSYISICLSDSKKLTYDEIYDCIDYRSISPNSEKLIRFLDKLANYNWLIHDESSGFFSLAGGY